LQLKENTYQQIYALSKAEKNTIINTSDCGIKSVYYRNYEDGR